MSIRARREQEKENMRNIILEAATKIIITEGYDKLSMRKIASAIDYSPTTIYIYYKDKAQIVEGISNRIYEIIVFNIKKGLEENKDLGIAEQLEFGFREFINSITSNAEMGKALIRSGSSAMFGPEETEATEENGVDILQSLLLVGQQQSILRKLDANVSWMLITALIGFAMNAIENQLYCSDKWIELVDSYTEILIKGLLARKGDEV